MLEIRKFIAAAIFFNTKAAEKVGLSLTDMQMIHMLQLYGPATPGRLAVWSGLSTGGVTVALDRLQKAGYIRREPNPADRRSLIVTLAPVRNRKAFRDVWGSGKRDTTAAGNVAGARSGCGDSVF